MAAITAFPPLSASVTRILSLSGFPAHLKTRDIQGAFSEWETVNGGFKIKWIDDTNLLMVFADAGVAKRAYLQALATPHPVFLTATSGANMAIKPYDGPDAQVVIQTVNARGGGPGGPNHRTRASMSAGAGPSPAVAAAQAHVRGFSQSLHAPKLANGFTAHSAAIGREPSPTLPSIPNQPSLNSLISSSLSGGVGERSSISPSPPSATQDIATEHGAPKIGDPGRRMVGAALGIRHPALAHRGGSNGGSADGLKDLQKAMASVSVSD